MRFRQCSKSQQAWIIFGCVLVVLGCARLLGKYTSWWTNLLVWLRRIMRLAVPVLLIGIGIYVIWASRNNKLNNFFGHAGKARRASTRLHRSNSDVRIAGVCGGIAQYFGIDSVFVRTVAVLLAFASPLFTLVIYGALVLVLKR